MATIINTPRDTSNESSGVGMIIGILVALALVALFLVYGLPQLQTTGTPQGSTEVNVDLPNVTPSTPSTPTTPATPTD